mmetsp:Transcript_15657/g.38307  ORF Transcript_15657/g.38307 Transcript_15657/m.38307 type:complete len:386 (+) Transcript_15657:724-1881(+)
MVMHVAPPCHEKLVVLLPARLRQVRHVLLERLVHIQHAHVNLAQGGCVRVTQAKDFVERLTHGDDGLDLVPAGVVEHEGFDLCSGCPRRLRPLCTGPHIILRGHNQHLQNALAAELSLGRDELSREACRARLEELRTTLGKLPMGHLLHLLAVQVEGLLVVGDELDNPPTRSEPVPRPRRVEREAALARDDGALRALLGEVLEQQVDGVRTADDADDMWINIVDVLKGATARAIHHDQHHILWALCVDHLIDPLADPLVGLVFALRIDHVLDELPGRGEQDDVDQRLVAHVGHAIAGDAHACVGKCGVHEHLGTPLCLRVRGVQQRGGKPGPLRELALKRRHCTLPLRRVHFDIALATQRGHQHRLAELFVVGVVERTPSGDKST